LRTGVFAIGAVLLIIGLALVLYNQPKVDLLVGIGGGMVGIMPEFQELQNEIFIGQMLMAIGVIIMIPGLILKKKEKYST
jgi:hypothetical protein